MFSHSHYHSSQLQRLSHSSQYPTEGRLRFCWCDSFSNTSLMVWPQRQLGWSHSLSGFGHLDCCELLLWGGADQYSFPMFCHLHILLFKCIEICITISVLDIFSSHPWRNSEQTCEHCLIICSTMKLAVCSRYFGDTASIFGSEQTEFKTVIFLSLISSQIRDDTLLSLRGGAPSILNELTPWTKIKLAMIVEPVNGEIDKTELASDCRLFHHWNHFTRHSINFFSVFCYRFPPKLSAVGRN